MALLEVSGLTKAYKGRRVVDEVSFSVAPGEVLGFLGPNGAGKSTTMKMISGFLAPDSGTISLAGQAVNSAPLKARRDIGYLPEGAPLYPEMRVEQYLSFIAQAHGLGGAGKRDSLNSIIDKVSLGAVRRQLVDTLSKGYRRRVGLAQALIHDPRVLILDEPTDGLDPNQKHEVRKMIRALVADGKRDRAIVLSTHILEEVDAVCSRVVIIDQGRIRANTTPDTLRECSPLHHTIRIDVPAASQSAAMGAITSGHQAVEDISRVIVEQNTDAACRLRVSLRDPVATGPKVLAAISGRFIEKAVPFHELHLEKGRLDDVFRSLTVEWADDRPLHVDWQPQQFGEMA